MNHFTSSPQNPELPLCEKSLKVFALVGAGGRRKGENVLYVPVKKC